jgi:hypothetical protein
MSLYSLAFCSSYKCTVNPFFSGLFIPNCFYEALVLNAVAYARNDKNKLAFECISLPFATNVPANVAYPLSQLAISIRTGTFAIV